MSRRYPPIYSIIALIVLVTVAATNTNGTALYISSTNAKTLATLISNIANQLGFVLTSGFAIVVSFADRLLCVLNEFSVLAHGHAMCNYWSYE